MTPSQTSNTVGPAKPNTDKPASRGGPAGTGRGSSPASSALTSSESIRESVEAVIVAIILTVMFRTFLGENYQIPTGSMAPTLQGRHMDVACPECGYQYRTGASIENELGQPRRSAEEVVGTTCPICRFPHDLDKQNDLNQRSFGGDRIIVSKVAYAFADPRRWDVFVFKFPGDPKVNYIKRLVGLPGETLKLRHGDAYVLDPTSASLPEEQQRFRIARKPPEKVEVMLQLIDDTYHFGAKLREINWPSRWDAVSETSRFWKGEGDGVFSVQGATEESWLGYRHLVPRRVVAQDWAQILEGKPVDLTGYDGMLVTDYYEYNDSAIADKHGGEGRSMSPTAGWNWVGDLAIQAELEVVGKQGEVLLDLIEGGLHHTCRIDIASGQATLQLDQGQLPFRDEAGRQHSATSGATPLRGPGKYSLRFANVDDQLHLWINDQLVPFANGTIFDSPDDLVPQWSEKEPGDLMPVRIGSRGADFRVTRLRVYRDNYYIAASVHDYVKDMDYQGDVDPETLEEVLTNPRAWGQWAEVFKTRREVRYPLGPDQFFPLGDNGPQSLDGRLWSNVDHDGKLIPPPYVDRRLLIGKAVFLYWPHSWNFPRVPFLIPNFQRIGAIR